MKLSFDLKTSFQKVGLLCLSFLFIFGVSKGQNVFVLNSDQTIHELLPDGSLVYRLTIKNFPNSDMLNLSDIAIAPSNKLYAMSEILGIVEIDWDTGDFTAINEALEIPAPSLVSGSEDELYYLNLAGELKRYYISLDSTELIADIGLTTPGDISFYKGHLIFPSGSDIKAYNLETEELVTIFCFSSDKEFYGITTRYTSCDSTSLLVPQYFVFGNPIFFEIDLDEYTATQFISTNDALGRIYGMANSQEYLGAACTGYVLEDVMDCILLTDVEDKIERETSLQLFPNPAYDRVSIAGCNQLIDVDIFNASGQLVLRLQEVENEIDISNLSSGLYHVSIRCGAEMTKVEKLIKH